MRRLSHPLADGDRKLKVLPALRVALGEKSFVSEAADIARRSADWRGLHHGQALAILRPDSVEQVQTIVRLCTEYGVAIVPQGGNTGLVAGSVPDDSGQQIVLCLDRLNRIRSVDPIGFSLTMEAGCLLAEAQRVAQQHERLFPLSLGAEGSCEIGGNIATNAGGHAVMRYGSMRELVLGLEVVLPDGSLISALRGLRKDNLGYDLKHLFVGAEGTLGVVTAACLKLFPLPREVVTAFVAPANAEAAVRLLSLAKEEFGDQVTAFEFMSSEAIALAGRFVPGIRMPLASAAPWFVLMEVSSQHKDGGGATLVESLLGDAFERGLIVDATVAASLEQSKALWSLREAVVEAQRLAGPSLKHDVSVPLSRVPAFLSETTAHIRARAPQVKVLPFGHLGDGNIHYNLCATNDEEVAALGLHGESLSRIVYDMVEQFGGSPSAEHGVGRVRRELLPQFRSPAELALMRRVKAALDPQGLFNPHVIFDSVTG